METPNLDRILAAGSQLSDTEVKLSLLPEGFEVIGLVAVKSYERTVKGKLEHVGDYQNRRTAHAASAAGRVGRSAAGAGGGAVGPPGQGGPADIRGLGMNFPEAVAGHAVQNVFTHPASPHALLDLGDGLHAEAKPGGKPGAVLRSNTGLQADALAKKGWTKTPHPAFQARQQAEKEAAAKARVEKAKATVAKAGAPKTAAKPSDLAKVTRAAGARKPAAGARRPPLPWTSRPGNVLEYKNHLGIDRSKMPQVSGTTPDGVYHPSSELMPEFMKGLQKQGVKVTHENVPSWSVRPTQTTGDSRVVRGIAESVKSGEETKPVIISRDNRVIDGHHTWAGHELAQHEGHESDAGMPVVRLGMDAHEALKAMQQFQDSKGIQARRTGEIANPAFKGLVDDKAKPSTPNLDKVTGAKPAAKSQAGKAAGYTPLSDEQYASYADRLDKALTQATQDHQTTEHTHGDGTGTVWSPERAAVHQEILKDMLARYDSVPREGKMVIAGGKPGAGKTYTLSHQYPGLREQFATINPDDMKEELAKRGLIPPLSGMPEATPMERSGLAHEESSYLAKQLTRQLLAQKTNIIHDITMDKVPASDKRITDARAAGYTHIHGMFIHIPAEKSVESVQSRHRAGLEDYRSGKSPLGERFVPSFISRSTVRADGSDGNRETFEALRPKFDSWDQFDRSDMKDAKKVASGGTFAYGGKGK
jgi:predicted ABC-type ATPase